MRGNARFIPEKLYTQFLQKLPLCCVDIVVMRGDEFLLVKRKHAPAKDRWWLPGGRLWWRESPPAAVRRKLREELGIKSIAAVEFLGIGESRFQNGYFGVPYHSVNLTFLARVSEAAVRRLALDRVHHTEYRWFKKITPATPSYVARFLTQAGFTK
ncbi:MAG: NUDIX domain-containing protein [Candidatus Liptonbacteria bacterium]|nr:NUDIX domain-containing protein [Candidatus Liptonbacteria bacterium]